MIRQAYQVGPYTVWFIQRLWDQAALEVYWQSLEVFQYARWYSPQRVERAANRAISHGLPGLDGLLFILEQELDRLSERRDTDFSGQLTFAFMGERQESTSQMIYQRDYENMSAGFTRTSSWESW
jgi:hypothetical protein